MLPFTVFVESFIVYKVLLHTSCQLILMATLWGKKAKPYYPQKKMSDFL